MADEWIEKLCAEWERQERGEPPRENRSVSERFSVAAPADHSTGAILDRIINGLERPPPGRPRRRGQGAQGPARRQPPPRRGDRAPRPSRSRRRSGRSGRCEAGGGDADVGLVGSRRGYPSSRCMAAAGGGRACPTVGLFYDARQSRREAGWCVLAGAGHLCSPQRFRPWFRAPASSEYS